MSDENWWSKRRKRPFFGSSFFRDVDEVFREMETMMEKELMELSKRAPRNLIREQIMPDGRKIKRWGPFVYGYSVTMGPNGKPDVREFGNIKSETRMGKQHIDIKEKREPLADVMATDGEIKVTVELPGVDKKDIKLYGTEDKLTISVDTPQRKYYKELELPVKTEPKKAKSTYKNGVLQITMEKKMQEKPDSEQLKIE